MAEATGGRGFSRSRGGLHVKGVYSRGRGGAVGEGRGFREGEGL